VVSTWDAFHGRTLAHVGGHRATRQANGVPPDARGFDHVAYDDLEAMDAACDPDRIGAVILEPILARPG